MKTMMDFITAVTQKTPTQPPIRKEGARNISSILSGLYRQNTESEWEWLRINHPEWWTKRIKLEKELDGHFPAGEPEATQAPFYQLVDHLKDAPIDELSGRIAKQLDTLPASQPKHKPARWKPPFKKLPGHPEPWQGARISGQEYFGMPPVKKQQHKK